MSERRSADKDAGDEMSKSSAHSAEKDAVWVHPFWAEPHKANPDLTRTYVQGGTGNTEAPCLTCAAEMPGRQIAVIRVIPSAVDQGDE